MRICEARWRIKWRLVSALQTFPCFCSEQRLFFIPVHTKRKWMTYEPHGSCRVCLAQLACSVWTGAAVPFAKQEAEGGKNPQSSKLWLAMRQAVDSAECHDASIGSQCARIAAHRGQVQPQVPRPASPAHGCCFLQARGRLSLWIPRGPVLTDCGCHGLKMCWQDGGTCVLCHLVSSLVSSKV